MSVRLNDIFFFKQKTAYEVRISDWSSDVCSSDLQPLVEQGGRLLTDLNPCSREGRGTLLSPLLLGGSTVWLRNPDESAWQRRYDEERATAQVREIGRASCRERV